MAWRDSGARENADCGRSMVEGAWHLIVALLRVRFPHCGLHVRRRIISFACPVRVSDVYGEELSVESHNSLDDVESVGG